MDRASQVSFACFGCRRARRNLLEPSRESIQYAAASIAWESCRVVMLVNFNSDVEFASVPTNLVGPLAASSPISCGSRRSPYGGSPAGKGDLEPGGKLPVCLPFWNSVDNFSSK